MKKKLKKIFNNKKGAFGIGAILIILATGGALVGGLALFAPHILSELGGKALDIINDILLLLIKLFGSLLGVFVEMMIAVAQYNDFINAPAVTRGWIIIRDVCNMFFIIVLLVIAFGTIFQVERYSYKHLLGGLLLAAVLVNFSKLICGLIIDVGQVFMLTFVNAFKDVAVGNFANLLGIQELLALQGMEGEIGGLGKGEIFIDLFLAFILTLLSVVVVGALLIILVIRIVVLWVLIIFSPFIFIAQVLPFTQSYARQYWSQFANQVIVGPAMAFMLWLTLSLASVSIDTSVNQALEQAGGTSTANPASAATSKISQATHLISYIFGIVMLVMCLTVGKTMGGIGGKWAGKAVVKVEGLAKGTVKLGGKAIKGTAGAATYRAREQTKAFGKRTVEGIEGATGIPLTSEARQIRKIRIRGEAEETWGGKEGARERAEMEIENLIKKKIEDRTGALKDKSPEEIRRLLRTVKSRTPEYRVYLGELARRGKLQPDDLKKEDISVARRIASQQKGVAPYYLESRYKEGEKGQFIIRGNAPEDKEAKHKVLEKLRHDFSQLTANEIRLTEDINFDPNVYGDVAIEALLSLDDNEIKKTPLGIRGMLQKKLEAVKSSPYAQGRQLIEEGGKIIEGKTYAQLAEEKLKEMKPLEKGAGKGETGEGAEKGPWGKQGNLYVPYELTKKGQEEEEERERIEMGKAVQNFQKKEEIKNFNSLLEKKSVSYDENLLARKEKNQELVEALNNLSKEVKNLAKKAKKPEVEKYADKFGELREKIIDFNKNSEKPLVVESMASDLMNNIRATWSDLNNELKKIVAQPKKEKKEETDENQ